MRIGRDVPWPLHACVTYRAMIWGVAAATCVAHLYILPCMNELYMCLVLEPLWCGHQVVQLYSLCAVSGCVCWWCQCRFTASHGSST